MIYNLIQCYTLYMTVESDTKKPQDEADQGEELGNPFPVRLKKGTQKVLLDVKKKSHLDKSELIRRCVEWALPKFLSGEIPIVEVTGKLPL